MINLTDENYERTIQDNNIVLVEFTADWCGPCKMFAPILDQVYLEYKGKVLVAKLDIDKNTKTPIVKGIKSIPTILIYNNGNVVFKQIGTIPKSKISEQLDSILKSRYNGGI